MANADFTFDPDITVTPENKIVLTGTVDPAVRDLQIYDQSGGVPDISIKDGIWTATYAFSSADTTTDYSFQAQYTDSSGNAKTSVDPTTISVGQAFNFSPSVTITSDDKVVLSGTVDPGVRNLQIYDSTGGVPDITIKPNGTWTATFDYGSTPPATLGFKADYTDASGQSHTNADQISLTVGIKGQPWSSELINLSKID